ncbi:MAG: hypothetical protein AAF533_21015 [Acidobacteriota bacterium]
MTIRCHRLVPTLVVGVATLMLLSASPVRASSWTLEVFGGYLEPSPEFEGQLARPLEGGEPSLDGPVFGLRGGYRFSRLRLNVSLSRFSEDARFSRFGTPQSTRRYESWTSDISVEFPVNPAQRVLFLVEGGGGIAKNRATDAEKFKFVNRSDTTTGTFHVGLGLELGLGRMYLRHDARVRWHASGPNSRDIETTFGLGFRLGRGLGPGSP